MYFYPIIIITIVSFILSIALHFAAIFIFPTVGLLDFPEKYGLTRKRIPYPTGIISVLLFLIIFSLFQIFLYENWSIQNIGIIVAVILLFIVSFIDDKYEIKASLRIFFQIIAALIVFAAGTRIFSLTNPLENVTGFPVIPLDTFVIPWPALSDPSIVGALFTIIWLGITTNALNWFDGIPGQVSLVSAIGFLTIGILSISTRIDQPILAILCFSLFAIAGGGFFFEFPKQKILQGDTGAMFYGFMLGIVTIYAGGKVATAFLVLGIPLIDFILVLNRRLIKGIPIFKGNTENEHLHHRLQKKGWSQGHIILLTASIGSAFGISALFFTTFEKLIAAVSLFMVMIVLSIYTEK
ncbi:MAG: undecaprenyl/decaprenyl-phosphate alpha-N-acetylglucosaminyl 1-phosphate transferase [Candidatus Peribacteraceae bacterium]|nr:undecaprenyl/decaprenyl-phosphate alpha-N-acetylglucosaminyl 1-phosphate transferase [Candidatus Peribacteraceae bacterium]